MLTGRLAPLQPINQKCSFDFEVHLFTLCESAPCHFDKKTIKLLVLLIDTRRVYGVVVLFSSKQRQVPRPSRKEETQNV